MNPLFSVIIPLYNSGNGLLKTLDSITMQWFKNFEILFIDGSSTDDTLSILKDFCFKNEDMRCTIISEPDKSIYDAYNKGINVAKGEWLYFMGGDDQLFSANVLQNISTAIDETACDLIYGNVTGLISGKKYIPDYRRKVFTVGLHHQGVFFKRTVFSQTGDYDLSFEIAADYYLMLKVFLNATLRTCYINTNVAWFGENGLSSVTYDYRFYSYYYRFLHTNHAIHEIAGNNEIFENSINCCFQLARMKNGILYGWNNLLFYIFRINNSSFSKKFVLLKRMIYWTLKT